MQINAWDHMTLRIPDDLDPLHKLAVEMGGAPAFVVREPAPDEEWIGEELPILRVQLEEYGRYLEVHTAVPAAGRTPRGALTFGEVISRLEGFGAESREVFWVSSLRPLAPETDPQLSGYAVRLALPLRSVLTAADPLRVAFLDRTDGLQAARTA